MIQGKDRKKLILLIDDDHVLSEMLKQCLEDAGHFVLTAFDGEHGGHMTGGMKPDLIVMDVDMPRKTGRELLKEIGKILKGARIPVLMISGGGHDGEEFRRMGAEAYLPKPFSMDAFLTEVSRILAKSAS